jgi:ferrous iron transport protein B
LKVALVGNPNTGKSSLFNNLTGLNQKVGNFPGVTMDKKVGSSRLPDGRLVSIIDLPGCYSLYPKTKDEAVVFQVLSDKKNESHPDLIVFIADVTNLKRNLLLYSQVADLGIPIILALNMNDLAEKEGIAVNTEKLSQRLGVQVVRISARQRENISGLKTAIAQAPSFAIHQPAYSIPEESRSLVDRISQDFEHDSEYASLLMAHQFPGVKNLNKEKTEALERLIEEENFKSHDRQIEETRWRYQYIDDLIRECVEVAPKVDERSITDRVDDVLTHKVWGFAIFFVVLLFIFQAIFSWAEYPMALIEGFFAWMDELGRSYLPAGAMTDLLLNGILAGLGGVLVFIPQIAILFAFIAILEDTGYMARITFLMDKMMRKVGLSGKSVVPMIGGLACAVPSIMAARNIESWKDRIITIMVTPLISCAARLPVYILLISLVVPDDKIFGFFDLRGLTLLGLYILGTVGAVAVAWVMKKVIKGRERSYFIMELPVYRSPRWKNILLIMFDKVKTFVFEVGKIIVAISIVLWVTASYGPPERMERIEQKYSSAAFAAQYPDDELERMRASEELENSYVGILGKAIEPAIRPLGFDWKIGIALITSVAAREVFVGTMATIYSVESVDDDDSNIREVMSASVNPATGEKVYTTATAFSLMVFYAFAMQCISTIAVVKRETNGWKWPAVQFGYMTAMAYLASLLVYQLLR